MAIRGHSNLQYVDPSYFAAEGLVASAGSPVVLQDPSGATGKPGDQNNTVVLPSGSGGEVFVGILLDEVLDQSRTTNCFLHDKYRAATTACRPVNLIRQGDVSTDQVDTTSSIIAGADAYAGPNGFTATANGGGAVGYFRGKPDANGFVLVHIDK